MHEYRVRDGCRSLQFALRETRPGFFREVRSCIEANGFPVFTGRTTSPRILVCFDRKTVIDASSIAGQLLPKTPPVATRSPTTHPWLSRAKEKAECRLWWERISMGRMHGRLKLRKSWPGQPSFGQAPDAAMFFLELLLLASSVSFFLYKSFIVDVPSCFDPRFFLSFLFSFFLFLFFIDV